MRNSLYRALSTLALVASCGSNVDVHNGGVTTGPDAADGGPAGPTTVGYEDLVVSLTFDDTFADHAAFVAPLIAGMPSTFYVNSPRLDNPGYMALTDVQKLAQEGHEIGAHTLHHLHATELDGPTQTTEMCDDLTALLAHGFLIHTMAYPFGDENPSARSVARACPFAGARATGNLRNVGPGERGYCGSPATSLAKADSEQIPPVDPFAIRTRASVRNACTTDDLTAMVQAAADDHKEIPVERRRWSIFNFHNFCDDCADEGTRIRKDVFRNFVTWLRTQNGTVAVRDAGGREIARRRLVVKTIAQVLEMK
jgi:peptidoglycan/xylan/chitin deacetylase (PgdA/CDA1 family)